MVVAFFGKTGGIIVFVVKKAVGAYTAYRYAKQRGKEIYNIASFRGLI